MIGAIWIAAALAAQPAPTAPPAPLTPSEQAAIDALFGPPPAGPPAGQSPAGQSPAAPTSALPAFAQPLPPAATVRGIPAASSNPRISLILDAAAAWFDGEPDQLGAHDPNRTGFTLQQLEMHIESAVDPYFELQANLVFTQFGVETEEAYARTLGLPASLQVKAGQFLAAMGRINPTHPHAWHFLDQPLVNGKFFGGEGSRGLGAEVSWLSPLPWYVLVIGSAHDAAGACCARSFFGGDNLGVASPADLLYTTRIEQFFPLSPSLSIKWGLSAQHGPNATGNANRTAIYGSDLYVRWRPVGHPSRLNVSWQTEALYRTRQVPDDRLEDTGLYSQLITQFALRWELGARFEHVTGVRNDPLDPDWSASRQRYTVQATFYPSHFSRVRLQGLLDDRGAIQVPAIMLGLETLIGAHGAHGF